MVKRLAPLLVALIHLAAAAGEPPSFTSRPTAKNGRAGARIEFAVKTPTDVVVEILDAKGRVVRHLGAGVLGKNPPLPFKPGLSQAIEWDGRDDRGKPVSSAGCRVRVRLSLRPRFSRFIEQDDTPRVNYLGSVGLAVDSKGNVLVLGGGGIAGLSGRAENRLMKFSPKGKYLRTLIPFSAKLEAKDLPGVDLVVREKNRLMPRIYERVSTTFMPAFESISRQTMAMTHDDRLVFLNGFVSELYGITNRRLVVIKPDGSIPRSRPDGPGWGESKLTGGIGHVAVDPQGKTAYVTGFWDGRYTPRKGGKYHHVVYRADIARPDSRPGVFFGQLRKAGGGRTHLNDPRGIAADGKGNIYVSDYGNGRVVVIGPDGKYLREFKVPDPLVMTVNPKTADLYVVCREAGGVGRLVKFPAGGKSGPAWKYDLGKLPPDIRRIYYPSLAVNWRAPKPVIYLGANNIYARYGVRKIVDNGSGCAVSDFIAKAGYQNWLMMLGVDPEDRVYVKVKPGSGNAARSFAIDGETGKKTAWWAKYYDNVALGRDGRAYQYTRPKGKKNDWGMRRTDLAKKVLPFSATGELSDVFRAYWAGRRDNLFVAADGKMHVLVYDTSRGGGGAGVLRIAADGKKTKKVLDGLLAPIGVKADRHGNIFVADNLKPAGKLWPDELTSFIKKLGPTGRREYEELYGSILKFGPKGGKVVPGAGKGGTTVVLSGGEKSYSVTGLKGSFVGMSPLPPLRTGFRSKCWCLGAKFDMDMHDRLFVPDTARFRVHVLDSNLNSISEFGGYGTVDDPGGKANAPGPDVPFECPVMVKVSGRAAYVLDSAPCAARIVRVKLTYAVEETCSIR